MIINRAFTARELADMRLPGFPATPQKINSRAMREIWASQPRQAIGGGREYPFSTLPLDLQSAIITRLSEENKMPTLQQEAPAATVDVNGADRKSAKFAIVTLFEKFRSTSGLPVLIAEEKFISYYQAERASGQSVMIGQWVFSIYPEFSARSLHRWRAQVEGGNLQDLSDRYGNRKGTSIIARAENGALANHIAAIILQMTHIKAGHVRDACRTKFGNRIRVKNEKTGDTQELPMPKIRAFERHIAAWKIENADFYEKLTNPDKHKGHKMLALGNASAGVDRLNQVWEIDASPADALCKDGRYAIYALVDIWSRRALFYVSKTARTEGSLLLIRRAVMEWGMPETIKTDHGSDFISKRFRGTLADLEIEHVACPPYSPEKKPHVERLIGTMQRDLMPLLPGFVGHNVSDRKQIEDKKTFAQGLGVSDAETFAVSMDHIELQMQLDRWAADKYAHKQHGSLMGQTPFSKAATWTQPVRKIQNERALDLLLSALADGDGFRVIGKKGLRINNGHFYGPGIELYVGKRVMVRHDPEDMGRVFVFTEDKEFICEATDYKRLGVDPVAAAHEAKARQKRAWSEGTRSLRREMRKITPEQVAEDAMSPWSQEAAKIASFPKQSETYSTVALEEAARATTKTEIPHERTAEEKVKDQAFIVDFNQMKTEVKQKDHSEIIWERALSIEKRLAAGETLSQIDLEWYEYAKTREWYTTRKDFEALRAAAGLK